MTSRCLRSVRRDGLQVIAVRGARSAAAPHSTDDPSTPHEPGYPVPAAGVPRPAQGTVQPRTAVGAAMSHEERVDLLAQDGVGSLPLARLALTPGVEARARHVEGRAQIGDGVGRLPWPRSRRNAPVWAGENPDGFF